MSRLRLLNLSATVRDTRKTNLERGLIAFVFEPLCLTGDFYFRFPQFFS